MEKLLKMVLNGQTVEEALASDARDIKAIGEDRREMTYDERIRDGYVTAKITPVPKAEALGTR